MTKLESKFVMDIIYKTIHYKKVSDEHFYKMYAEILENVKGFKIVSTLEKPFKSIETENFIFFKFSKKKVFIMINPKILL